jgi:serine/threonine protein kinase
MNVLIDDGGKALLSDFGLSRIKADTTSRMDKADAVIAGSRNWMSPERLAGRSLRNSSDIYALGMTIYEACDIQYRKKSF